MTGTEAPKSPGSAGQSATVVPFWRHQGVRRIAIQVAFLAAVLVILFYFYNNMIQGMNELGLTLGYRFLQMEAGFAISEGIAYQPSDTYARAFLVGIVNTIKVILAAIVAASLIGLLVGIASLSSNWLVRSLARVYVEVFRNVPLLLQLLFWYSAVILKLPPVRQSVEVFESFFLSQRGLYLPRLVPGEGFSAWLWFAGCGLAAGAVVYVWVRHRLQRLDRPGFPSLWAWLTAFVAALAGWFLVPQPVDVDPPVLQRFNFTGGMHLSPEFAAILLGLSVYTGAFIAEVVRGGIQAVDRGQSEAALALGLKSGAVMYLVVLPQALRVIVPPITSQYLNLAKNSSLAVAIGYPELFNVGTTIMNQTGQTIPVFSLIMACYLTLSLITSAFMNWYNRKMRLVER